MNYLACALVVSIVNLLQVAVYSQEVTDPGLLLPPADDFGLESDLFGEPDTDGVDFVGPPAPPSGADGLAPPGLEELPLSDPIFGSGIGEAATGSGAEIGEPLMEMGKQAFEFNAGLFFRYQYDTEDRGGIERGEGDDNEDGPESSVGFNVGLARDRGGRPGLFYDARYGLTASAREGDYGELGFDHDLGGGIGHQGARTTARLDGSYRDSDGNIQDAQDIDRERQEQSTTSWSVNGSISRTLSRGSLSFSAGTSSQTSDSQRPSQTSSAPAAMMPAGVVPEGATSVGAAPAGALPAGAPPAAIPAVEPTTENVEDDLLNDTKSYFADLVLYQTPSWAPKTSFGLGVNAGRSETDTSPDQSWWEPSLRWRYAMTEKMDLHAQVGRNFRTFETSQGAMAAPDSEEWVFDGGIDWSPTQSTIVSLSLYREVSSSLTTVSQNTTDTGIGLNLTQNLPFKLRLAGHARLERSEFSNIGAFSELRSEVVGAREDDFYVLGLDLSRSFDLSPRLTLTTSMFYNYSQNVSDLAEDEYTRHSVGLRASLAR